MTDSVVRSGSRSTAVLVAAVDALEASGKDRQDALRLVFGRFPVAGLATYSHDWWFPRFGPTWRLHQGTDIFAKHGTPVLAPLGGRVSISNGALGGLSVRVTGPDGTFWYLAHLAAVADGLVPGATVQPGDVVGYVGNSGNARTTPPHLHLEIHPGGGKAIDPKATLDALLAQAEAVLPGRLSMPLPGGAATRSDGRLATSAPLLSAVSPIADATAPSAPKLGLAGGGSGKPGSGRLLAFARPLAVASSGDRSRRTNEENAWSTRASADRPVLVPTPEAAPGAGTWLRLLRRLDGYPHG